MNVANDKVFVKNKPGQISMHSSLCSWAASTRCDWWVQKEIISLACATSSWRACSKECMSLCRVAGLVMLAWHALTSGSCFIFPAIWAKTYNTGRRHYHECFKNRSLMSRPDCLPLKQGWRTRYTWITGWYLFRLYLFAVSEELVQLVWCCQHLPAGLHQLQEVGPRLVQSVLPLSDGGCIWVATVDHLIHHFVHLLHALLANVVGFWGKLGESLLKHLEHT